MPDEGGVWRTWTSGQRRAALLALAIAYGFNTADRQLLSILAGPVKTELQLSDTQLGLMGGVAFALFYATCSLPLAWIADRWSRAKLIAMSLGLWSLFTAACGLVQNASQLFLCRLGVGFGEAGGTAPSFSLISDYYPPHQRARAIALLNFAAPLGVALGPLAAALIADALDWRAAFLIAGTLGFFFVPVFCWAVRDPSRMPASAALVVPAKLSAAESRNALKQFLYSKSFWLLTTAAALSSMVLQGVLFWLPSFLERTHGLALKERAILFGVVTATAGVAGNWASGWIVDRFGSHHKLCALLPAAAGLIAIPVYALALNASTVGLATPFLFIGMAMTFAYSTPVYAAVQHLVPAGLRSTGIAAYLLVNNSVGMGLGVVLLGLLSDRLTPLFGVEALKISISAVVCLYVPSAVLFALCARGLDRDWIGE